MYFEYNDEQLMLQKSAKNFFDKHFPIGEARKFTEHKSFNKKMKDYLNSQGFLDVLELGDTSSIGAIFASIISLEAGRVLLSFPLLEQIISHYYINNDQNGEKEIYKDSLLTIGWGKNNLSSNSFGQEILSLTGTCAVVPFANECDYALVSIPAEKVPFRYDNDEIFALISLKSEAINIKKIESFDETYPIFDIVIKNYPLSTNDFIFLKNQNAATHYQTLGNLLLSAEMVGGAQAVLKQTVAYTKERTQFGTEIGKFQAIKHMAADMSLLVESAKVAVEYASWAIEEDKLDFEEAVLIANTYTSQAYVKVVEYGIQIHGGIGATWEHDMHLFLKRAQRGSMMLSSPYLQRKKLATQIFSKRQEINSH
jgi:alkylation response protein AidB-like acyl-CoA dehydrogenase